MDISIFEVLGPVMVGPSSSHTAGAARLARIAALIVGCKFNRVTFGLHGSFARTYKGHGTDKALLAGVQGIREDDERLAFAYELAEENGLDFEFYEVELDDVHENSVLLTFECEDGTIQEIIGSSIGGGQILICRINAFETEFSAQSHTLLLRHHDRKGVLSKITGTLSEAGVNIAVMKLDRRSKGDMAFCMIETDDPISEKVVQSLRSIEEVVHVTAVAKPE